MEVQQAYNPLRKRLILPRTGPVRFIKRESESMKNTKDLKSQVDYLEKQLTKTKTENKLLRRDLHQHTVALKFFQDPQNNVFEITTTFKEEMKAMCKVLDDTFDCCESLAKQLQATEKKLEATMSNIQQLLVERPSQLEKKELTVRLTKATEELQEKERKIKDLEQKLEMSQSSFKRQLLTEQKKCNEAKKKSCQFQEQIDQLSREMKKKEKELENFNLYSRRFSGQTRKKADKMVQMDGFDPIPRPPSQRSKPVCSGPERCHPSPVTMVGDRRAESSFPGEKREEKIRPDHLQESAVVLKDNGFKARRAVKRPPNGFQRDSAHQSHAPEEPRAPQQKMERQHGASGANDEEKSLIPTKFNWRKIRQQFTFKDTDNLHKGKAAHSSSHSRDHRT